MGWAGDGPAVGLPKSGITMVVTSYFSKLDTQDALSQRSSLVATGVLLAVALLISGASLPDSGEEVFASRADTSLVLRAYELGSQFFITHAPQPHLDGRHTVFGRVVEGQDVVDAVKQGDTIESIEIES